MLHIASLCAWCAKQLQLIIRRSVVTPSLWRARIVCNVEKIPDRVQLHSVTFLIQILRSCLLTSAFPHLSIKNQNCWRKLLSLITWSCVIARTPVAMESEYLRCGHIASDPLLIKNTMQGFCSLCSRWCRLSLPNFLPPTMDTSLECVMYNLWR